VAATWFGPRGRLLATGLLLASQFVPEALQQIGDEWLEDITFHLAIAASLLAPLCALLIFKNPDYSPTMSEEERFVAGTVPFREQCVMLTKDRAFLVFAGCASMLLIASNHLIRVLEILQDLT